VPPAARPPLGEARPHRPDVAVTPSDRARLARARDEFPIAGERAYLFSGGIAPAPRRASEAIAAWLALWSHDPGAIWERRHEAIEEVRERLGRILGVPARTLALTDSTSRACNLAVALLDPPPGANVVVDATTYPSCLYPWLRPVRPGLEVRRAANGRAGSGASPEDVAICLDERSVAVSISHVAPETGLRHDLRSLAEVAHAGGAALIVDVAQSAGVVPLDLAADGVDLAAGTAMKWLLGPPGIGFLYVSEALLARTGAPQVGYAHARLAADGGQVLLGPDARRHELGIPPLLTMPGFAAALDIVDEVGVRVIQAHVAELVEQLMEGLGRLGLAVITPTDAALRAGIVALPGREPSRVAGVLRDRGVDVWGSDKRELIRVDVHLFNDGGDIERCLRALADCRASI
jgi:selenocysteine lyase/cysteine desulfurase